MSGRDDVYLIAHNIGQVVGLCCEYSLDATGKVQGVYAGVCHDVFSAERLRKSNDAQVLTMGARVIGPELAKTIVDAWLVSEFQGGGSTAKVQQMRELERQSFNNVK